MTTLLAFCHALGRETTVPFSSFRLAALVIAQHCKPLSGDGAYPALRTIAKKCGLSKSTVHRAVGWFTAHGRPAFALHILLSQCAEAVLYVQERMEEPA